MKLIGVTGWAGVGKSMATKFLAEGGAKIIDADELGHQALCAVENLPLLREAFPLAMSVAEPEKIDRKKLGEIVFTAPEKLQKLESISHPYIRRQLEQLITECKKNPPIATGKFAEYVAIDAALLKLLAELAFDKILLIAAPFAVRLARVKLRGWTATELRRRDAALLGKTHNVDDQNVCVVNNDGDVDKFLSAIAAALA